MPPLCASSIYIVLRNRSHLECLQYLRERGCPWDERTCSSAAKNGHLECLKYLYENGCPRGVVDTLTSGMRTLSTHLKDTANDLSNVLALKS